MKCYNCTYENEQGFSFCPQCGAPAQPAFVEENSVAKKVLSILKDNLFLVICILLSAYCVISLAHGDLPLLRILITIFLWLTYSQSRKDIADAKQLRHISGTVYAHYIINYVLAGLLVLVGVLLAAAFGLIAGNLDLITAELPPEFMDSEYYEYFLLFVASISGSIILLVFLLAAVGVAVVNAFSMRYIHRFAKSLYVSIETQNLNLKHVNGAQIWLFIFGAVSAVGALSSLLEGETLSGFAGAADSAAAIIAGLLIRRHLTDSKEETDE